MDTHDRLVIHSSAEANYRTPSACYQLLDREFHFVWDLAADEASSLVNAQYQHGDRSGRSFFGPGSEWAENALTASWQGPRGAKFLNPPFSKTLVNAFNTGRIKIDGQWVSHEEDPEKAKAYDIANWAEKCWTESQAGATIVGVFPFAPQTDWYRKYVYGHIQREIVDGQYPIWHAAREERRLPHRISFLQPDGTPTGNAGVNSVILVWKPNYGIVGPWQPHQCYWSYR